MRGQLVNPIEIAAPCATAETARAAQETESARFLDATGGCRQLWTGVARGFSRHAALTRLGAFTKGKESASCDGRRDCIEKGADAHSPSTALRFASAQTRNAKQSRGWIVLRFGGSVPARVPDTNTDDRRWLHDHGLLDDYRPRRVVAPSVGRVLH